ncbi:MAG: hypothetical protein U9P36_08600 [Thermodesulfobacteriota bacterium]|nr:hypothetical protein [Thermodesulfobacteriota bacterium]
MKILIDKNVIEFTLENPQETADMEALWRVLVDCVGDNKRMEPIGEYIPSKSNVARFITEDLAEGVEAKTVYTEDQVTEECTVVCTICNKYAHLKAGDSVPVCCGRPMETMD